MNDADFSLSSRAVSAVVGVSGCETAMQMFRNAVSPRTVVRGSDYEPKSAMSIRAISRGIRFEDLLRMDTYADLREKLSDPAVGVGADVPAVSCVRQKRMTPRQERELDWGQKQEFREKNWRNTVKRIADARSFNEPLLLESAQVKTDMQTASGDAVYYEADFILVAAGLLWVLECKSWPIVAGRSESPDGDGKALDQAGMYVAALEDHFAASGKPLTVAGVALVNPRDTSAYPVVRPFPRAEVQRRVNKARESVALVNDDGGAADSDVVRAAAAPTPAARVGIMNSVIDSIGHSFDPELCANHCAMALLCHERAYRAGDVSVVGAADQLSVTGVSTFRRVRELADGGEPTADESALAADLAYAKHLIGDAL